MHGRRILVAVAAAALVASTSAVAGAPGTWTRLPGTVVNYAEPGLARTGDGTLHVVWTRKNGTKAELVHAAVKPSGAVGSTTVALTGWSSMSHPDLLRMPDGSLRAFFGGIRTVQPNEPNDTMNTATAPAAGTPWTLQTGNVVQSTTAYATAVAGAALTKDGTPISTWSTTPGVGYHFGTDAADPDVLIKADTCCLYDPDVAVDATTGAAYVAFWSNQKGAPGVFAQAIGPTAVKGARVLAPGSVSGGNSLGADGRTPITGRIGAAGVFVVYGQGYPTFKTVAVWRVGGAKPQLVVKADGAKHPNVAPAPEGRLWLVWDQGGKVWASRTNRAVTRIGPPSAVSPPAGGTVYRLNGEGSAGPLDVIANVGGGGQSLWHQQVWPRLSLQATAFKRASGRTVRFRVTDAGDAVAGAKVKVGGKTFTTDRTGTVVVGFASTAMTTATASKAGYVKATAKV
jgi:hypothetical protein